jgi:TetR/AcrR family transcriptional regulator, repressor of fatR-cypB operon
MPSDSSFPITPGATLQAEPTDGMSRRERERRMRRRAMLDAAQSVFAEKGYARATLDEIAERAEFGKGTLYNYFEGGKEEILYAIFDQLYVEITQIIADTFVVESRDEANADADTDRSLRDSYHDLVMQGFTFYTERENLLIILQKEAYRMAFSDESDRARFFHAWHERILDTARPAIERAVHRGEIRDLPAQAVAHMLIENLNSLLVHRTLARRSHEALADCSAAPEIFEDAHQAADFLTAMLFDGLTSSAQP